MEPRVVDWTRMNVGAAANDALALIENDLRDGQYKTDRLAYAHIDKGDFTPELALALFYKKHALYSLQTKLMQQAQQGVSAAKRIKDAEADENG